MDIASQTMRSPSTDSRSFVSFHAPSKTHVSGTPGPTGNQGHPRGKAPDLSCRQARGGAHDRPTPSTHCREGSPDCPPPTLLKQSQRHSEGSGSEKLSSHSALTHGQTPRYHLFTHCDVLLFFAVPSTSDPGVLGSCGVRKGRQRQKPGSRPLGHPLLPELPGSQG